MNFDYPSKVSFADLSFGLDLDLGQEYSAPLLFTPADFETGTLSATPSARADVSSSFAASEASDSPRRTRRAQSEWAPEEDSLLRRLAACPERGTWPHIARAIHRQVPGAPVRSPAQCSQRWARVANPAIRKGKWSPAEDAQLVAAIVGSPPRRWRLIADKVQGRTDIQVRYRLQAIGEGLVRQRLIGRECLPE
ncbi:Myb-like DNA-binding domain-containing protein [Spironucleus salmonicida]|uniref:Myb-like DNA-binding domain-containing protein n=1 Tax=Spironucleus salmonicida TaxID=348837 RepID=A0A9P8RZ18_9EUKA|nr:Myb-like DNA-binding domain-containing protein [Spironucleus salmonicida]